MAVSPRWRDRGWKRLTGDSAELAKHEVATGVIEGLGPARDDDMTNAEIAAVHEFGSSDGRIPQRSFMTRTFDKELPALKAAAADASKRVARGAPVQRALGVVGAMHAGQIQGEIASGIEPALAPATIEAKGSIKPLIDSGRLRQSITSAVRRR